MRSSPPRPPDRPRATLPAAKGSISERSAPECSIWECSVSAYPISKRSVSGCSVSEGPIWGCSISGCPVEGCTAAGCVAEGCRTPGCPAVERWVAECAKGPMRAATSGSREGEGGAFERPGSAAGVRFDRLARRRPTWWRSARRRQARRRSVRQRSARQGFARQWVTWQRSVRRRRGGRGPVNDQGPGAASSRGPASPRPPAKTRSPELSGSFPVGPLPGGARLPLRVSPRRGPAILGCGHPNEGYWARKQPIRIEVR